MKLSKIALFIVTLLPNIVCASPVISSVSSVSSEAIQKIVINGSGFGTQQPYDGNSPYIKIINFVNSTGYSGDSTVKFNAGSTRDPNTDTITLNISSWTDTQITVSGFAGDYGRNGWTFAEGDIVTFLIWNAQTREGPAVYSRIVNDVSSISCIPPNPATLAQNLDLHIPQVSYQLFGIQRILEVDLKSFPTSDGKLWWILDKYSIKQ